jgi:hypothetical protein
VDCEIAYEARRIQMQRVRRALAFAGLHRDKRNEEKLLLSLCIGCHMRVYHRISPAVRCYREIERRANATMCRCCPQRRDGGLVTSEVVNRLRDEA